ncbi:NAD(P)-dependent alcohol dehydrogenase [Devosia sp.]|uniref:NAD(P)-dependent alcohol dehydrogenase n=1 Tax=Devosia sp. TaxID=1871048 RepID=UPI0019E6619A|nr:NAD(P)-dependent alcohol dehydrogenase [Devosia sp.]MBE0579544.1 NAD(P)-dependent alcohol dehydrogenase [Devosia sp.]
MRAVYCTRYGPPDVLELRDVPKPEPKPGQVLVRVHAAGITLGDCEVRAFKMVSWVWVPARLAIGITRPRQPVLGMEVAGVVEALGEGVTRFKVGDRVFGPTGFGMGAYAEYATIPEAGSLTTIPPTLSYAEAAGIPTGGLNGLHFVRKCDPQPGEKVLINGAGGSIGMFATQLSKGAGAEVTAVDRVSKHQMLSDLGADKVIDYESTDFWRTGECYDAIIDVVGLSPFGPSVTALNDGGRYFLGNPHTRQMLRGLVENRRGRVKVLFQLAGEPVEDLDSLKQQIADRRLKVVVDKAFPLEDAIDAHRYVESGAKTGIVVLDVSGEASSRG